MKGAYKVQGGKMLKVEFELEANTISSFSLTGDFFLYPEEGVDLLNKALEKCPLSEDEIEKRISEAISINNLEAVGFGPKDIANAIIETNEKEEK